MSRNQPKVGARDHCRRCNKVIVYRKIGDQWRGSSRWDHVDPAYPEEPHWCKAVERERYLSREDREAGKKGEKYMAPEGHAAPKKWCTESVTSGSGWYSNTCHRPVKDPDLFMCGIHARRVRDEEKKRKEYEENAEIQAYISNEVDKLTEALREEFDIPAEKEYKIPWNSGRGYYSGKVVVDPKLLLELLRDLGNEEAL